jgi:Tfp pilus assembly protein PilF
MYSSQINNNLGILLEDHQLENQAAAAYQRAIQLETNNVSATMNLLALQKRLNNPNAENTEKQLETMLATRLKQLSVWQLSSRYGYIRDPAFYMAQGYAWAISGKPSAAIHEIKRAMEITGEKSDIKHILANLYIQADDINAGQQTYQALLDSNPEDTQALYGLARLAVTKGNVQLAQQYLNQLQQLGMNPDSKELEELFISIAIQNDNYSNSKKMLRDMLKKNPDNVRLWAVLGYLAGTNNDIGTANEARDILQRHLEHNPVFAVVLAQLEAQQGSLETAGNYLKTAVQHLPSNIRIREQYLETLVNLRRRDKAEEQAAAILNMDPDNALANYIMGTIQASRSELALAENSYRTSLKSKTNPMVLNDLAWLLARTGSFDEAHSLVNKSLKLFPNNPNALDTLGYIQLNIGEYKQGEDNIRRALNFYPNNPAMLLHLALSLEKQGKAEQALQIAEPLLTRMHEMTMDDYETTRQLTTRLR